MHGMKATYADIMAPDTIVVAGSGGGVASGESGAF